MNKENLIITILIFISLLGSVSYSMSSWFQRRTAGQKRAEMENRPWASSLRQKESVRQQDLQEREKKIQDRVRQLKAEGKTDDEINTELLFKVYRADTPEERKKFRRIRQSIDTNIAYQHSSSLSPKAFDALKKEIDNKRKLAEEAIKQQEQTPEYKAWPYRPENYQQKSTLASWWSNLWSSKPQTNKTFINPTPSSTSSQQASSNWLTRWWYGK